MSDLQDHDARLFGDNYPDLGANFANSMDNREADKPPRTKFQHMKNAVKLALLAALGFAAGHGVTSNHGNEIPHDIPGVVKTVAVDGHQQATSGTPPEPNPAAWETFDGLDAVEDNENR